METRSVVNSGSGDGTSSPDGLPVAQIQSTVADVLRSTEFIDIHTHLFAPAFGNLGLWGIDELLTYHYLEAEFFRSADMSPERYWELSKKERAEAIWRALFVENSPISEATRGIIAVLRAFDLPTESSGLEEARSFFYAQNIDAHITRVLQMAGVSTVAMTNDPLHSEEQRIWMNGYEAHPQFHAVLRLDRIVRDWPAHWQTLAEQGYAVEGDASGRTLVGIRRFLSDWYQRMRPVYMAVSLPDSFQFPEETVQSRILSQAVLPSCREFNLPLSLMIGVRYQVNPRIRLAGDAVGKANLRSVESLCRHFPENRFLVSLLSRENQHELCVYARKFNNLMPFGCWWFLNNPSIVKEITRERIEMLGTSFIPQHSDARVLEQVIYKWRNTRATLACVLAESYRLLARDGRAITRQLIQRDVDRLFRSNFEKWTGTHVASSVAH
ncbi:MAG: glucuronate isomerase [Acidobacteria bacterium]|nr:MAG: glucuronate isomerase [Acidobacteriota bacterium]PYY06068.1 MAG: glucuronate isomerase [Acidobacteriota bacterium]